jgi:hypothetical protein
MMVKVSVVIIQKNVWQEFWVWQGTKNALWQILTKI